MAGGNMSGHKWLKAFVLFCFCWECCWTQTEKFISENSGLLKVPTGSIGPGVYSVSLKSNDITGVGAYAFNQTYIREVYLNNNQITYIDPNAFLGTALEYLDLGTNKLTTIPNLSVVGSSLVTLLLSTNLITSLSPSPIPGLTVLKKLDLNGNALTVFPNLETANLTLEELILWKTKVANITSDDIDYFASLRILSIPSAGLTTFPNLTAMPCVGNLRTLKVGYQPFGVIESELLIPLVGLKHLYINGNGLTSLPILTSLQNLKQLEANDNEISSVTAEHFQGLNQLVTLNLDNNRLRSFPDVSPLSNSLINLYLGSNDIATIDNDRLLNMTANMWTLENIELDTNALASLPDIYHAVEPPTLQSITLMNNPLVCDSSISWLKEAEDEGLSTDLQNTPCSGPSNLAGVKWADVSTKQMSLQCGDGAVKGGQQAEFTLLSQDKRVHSGLVETGQSATLLECAAECTQNLHCWSFSYGQSTGECLQSTLSDADGGVFDIDAQMYAVEIC